MSKQKLYELKSKRADAIEQAEKALNEGNRAEHDINGFINIVIKRLLLLSIAREARIAGTLQPKPITNGINDLP